MPTFIAGSDLVHVCRYCGTPHNTPRTEMLPFHYQQRRCDGCGKQFDDLDPDTTRLFEDFLQGRYQ